MPSFFDGKTRRSALIARRSSLGFTLPELLVVVSIIGTLSTVGVVSYNSARSSARDVKRVSDMKQVQTSLELFFENNNFYPGDGRPGTEGLIMGLEQTQTLSDAGFAPKLQGTPYMVKVPKNPEPFGTPYVYRSLYADGTDCNDVKCASYAILFTLERPQGNYLAGPHAMTPAGIAGAEGGYAGQGIVAAGGQIVGIEAVQAQLDVIASQATNIALEFADNKTVEAVAQGAVAPAVTAVAAANTVFSTSSAASYFFYFLTQPFVFFGRKRRKAWGTVYNALSKLPEDLVILRLRDASSGRTVKSTVSDIKGRFSFLVPRGHYRIEAAKNAFAFPSKVTAGKKEDGQFLDLYHGEIIEVGQDGAILTPNIPLDPVGETQTDEVVLKKEHARRLQRAVALLSPTLGGVSLVIKPSIFVALMFAAQIVVYFLFRRLAEPPEPKSWGIVYEKGTKKPVPQAILRIFEAKYNKLLETQVTDRNGRYHFRVGGNVYYLTVTKPGYLKTETDPIDLTKVTEPTVIASDLPLAAAKGQPKAPEAPKRSMLPPPPPKPGYAAGPAATWQPGQKAGGVQPAAGETTDSSQQTERQQPTANGQQTEAGGSQLAAGSQSPVSSIPSPATPPASPVSQSPVSPSASEPPPPPAPPPPPPEKKEPPPAWFRDV